ncbi:MAG: M48 family metallopeptidase [Bacteroidaceae bacterium]|nr:M48 family metallopeptidase [Bacteroidaceae bacterium]
MQRFFLRLSYDFSIETEYLSFRFLPPSGYAQGVVRHEGNSYSIVMPAGFDFGNPRHMLWANVVLKNTLREQARRVIAPRLRQLAAEYGLAFNRVYIKDVVSRWGSCSSARNINISLWLLLAPTHLVDYVLKHELAHLSEMNHSARFWAEADRMTGGAGTAKRLENEMKAFARTLQRLWL